MEDADQQNLAQLKISKRKIKLLFALGIFLIAVFSEMVGYMLGKSANHNNQPVFIPTPTTILFRSSPTPSPTIISISPTLPTDIPQVTYSIPTAVQSSPFEMPELGIQIQVPNTIKDEIIYDIRSFDNGLVTADFTTKTLLSKYDCTYGSVGAYSKIPKSYIDKNPNSFYNKDSLQKQTVDSKDFGQAKVKEFPDYYIYFEHPQAVCAAPDSLPDTTEGLGMYALWDGIKSVEQIK